MPRVPAPDLDLKVPSPHDWRKLNARVVARSHAGAPPGIGRGASVARAVHAGGGLVASAVSLLGRDLAHPARFSGQRHAALAGSRGGTGETGQLVKVASR